MSKWIKTQIVFTECPEPSAVGFSFLLVCPVNCPRWSILVSSYSSSLLASYSILDSFLLVCPMSGPRWSILVSSYSSSSLASYSILDSFLLVCPMNGPGWSALPRRWPRTPASCESRRARRSRAECSSCQTWRR
ncbi:hypothetical protein EGW08_023661 [Elysia chlorotica]|uniref:Uncharacterized protein n=1 Tax=Elysia chlorotica TaxID=188477 RepID=A0A433SI80_ELYCH|nr:hypothetical protein EGW08_023661 [Elysia chlorotica]